MSTYADNPQMSTIDDNGRGSPGRGFGAFFREEQVELVAELLVEADEPLSHPAAAVRR